MESFGNNFDSAPQKTEGQLLKERLEDKITELKAAIAAGTHGDAVQVMKTEKRIALAEEQSAKALEMYNSTMEHVQGLNTERLKIRAIQSAEHAYSVSLIDSEKLLY